MEKKFKFYVLSSTDEPDLIRYVGVTQKESVQQRFYGHKYCATHPEKRGLPVHKWMWSKYEKGLDIIVKEIDSCLEKDWEDREKYWISYYNSGGKLLNISEGGKGVIPKEARSKDSLKRSAERHYKQITLLDNKGNIIEHCPSEKYAVEKYNLSRTSLGNVLSGRSKSTGGYYVVLTETYNSPNFNISQFLQQINDSKKVKKSVYRYSLEGNLIEVQNSIQEYYKLYKFDKGAVSRAINNKTIYKDSYWSYNTTININDYEPLYKYLWNNKKYKTLKNIAEELGLNPCTISNAKRNNKPVKGFFIQKL